MILDPYCERCGRITREHARDMRRRGGFMGQLAVCCCGETGCSACGSELPDAASLSCSGVVFDRCSCSDTVETYFEYNNRINDSVAISRGASSESCQYSKGVFEGIYFDGCGGPSPPGVFQEHVDWEATFITDTGVLKLLVACFYKESGNDPFWIFAACAEVAGCVGTHVIQNSLLDPCVSVISQEPCVELLYGVEPDSRPYASGGEVEITL